jgi:hypothetical protein
VAGCCVKVSLWGFRWLEPLNVAAGRHTSLQLNVFCVQMAMKGEHQRSSKAHLICTVTTYVSRYGRWQ